MAQAFKALSEPVDKRHIIYEIRILLAQAEQKLQIEPLSNEKGGS
jgi:hypothetical protein